MAEHAEKPLVHVRNLSKVFVTEKVETHALSNLTFDIERGEYLVVQGPSGCGKSTLLAILGLLDEPTGGEYRLADTDTSGLNLTRRAHLRNRELGFVFQAFNLVADLTIRGERRVAAALPQGFGQAEAGGTGGARHGNAGRRRDRASR